MIAAFGRNLAAIAQKPRLCGLKSQTMDIKRLFLMIPAAALAAAAQIPCAQAEGGTLEYLGMREYVSSDGLPCACITFNDDLSGLTPLDLNSMLSVEGPATDRAEYPFLKVHGSEICMNYLMFGTDYKATFKQGLTGLAGKSLKEDLSVSFTSLSMLPRAAAYPVRASKKDGAIDITVSTVNLKAVRVSVAEVPQQSLDGIAMQDDSGPAVGTTKAARILAKGYTLLAERVLSLPSAHDSRTRTVISVPAKVKDGCSYLVLLTDPLLSASKAIDNAAAGSRASLWGANLFINTPVSVIASRVGQTLYLSASHDSSADDDTPTMPAADAEITLFDRHGVQLDSTVFNSEGRTSIGHLSRFGKKLDGAVLHFYGKYGQIQLPLPEMADRTGSSRGSLIVESETDRSSCMPGDTISYMALDRTSNGGPAPSREMTLDVVTPDGAAFKSLRLASAGYGAYRASIKIPSSAQGGAWTLRLRNAAGDVADERRIEVADTSPDGFTAQYDGAARTALPGSRESISFRALYHGEHPAYGILGEAKVTYSNDRYPFEGYSEFAAGPDPHEKSWNDSYKMGAAATGDDGVATFQLDVPEYTYPRLAKVEASFRGQQDGQQARAGMRLHIAPSDNICGVRIISAEGRSIAQAKLFSPQGKPVSGRIYYKISRLDPMPSYVHRPSGWRYEFEHMPVKLSSGQSDFNASRDASGEIQLPTGNGLHLLELATGSGMRTSLAFINGYAASSPSEQKLNLKIWNTGGADWAASFSSPYEGRGVLSVDGPSGRDSKSIKVLKGSNTVPFTAKFNGGDELRVELGAFFGANEDLAYCGRGEASSPLPESRRSFAPIVDAGQRQRTPGGDRLLLRLRPRIPGSECSYAVMAVSIPYSNAGATQLDRLSDRVLDRAHARTAFSGIFHSRRGEDETVEIPLGTDDQVLDVKVLCWNDFYSGKTERSYTIRFPARISIDPISYLNAGDVAAPRITIANNLDAADFKITASCLGAAACATRRDARIVGGDSESFLLPITARSTGRASLRLTVESGSFKREIRRDFDVVNPWPPMVYTELLPLEAGTSRIYSSDLNFSPISRGSISCGPMPYANLTVLTRALLSRRFAAISDNIMAALGLVDANHWLPGSATSSKIQSLIDTVAAMVTPDGGLRGSEKYQVFHTITASLLMSRAAAQGYSVGRGTAYALRKRCEQIRATEKDSALQALLLYVEATTGHDITASSARARAIELLNAPDMTSPAAISMLACVLHEAGDDDEAALAISLSITRMRRILALLDLFNNEDDSNAFPRLYDLMDCGAFPIASPQMHAASMVYATARTGLTGPMDQALALFRNDGFSSSSRAAVNAILLSLSALQQGQASETPLPDNWEKVTLQNRTEGPMYCTAAAYGYDLDKALMPENSDLKVKVAMRHRDSQPSMPANIARLGEDFVLIIDVTSKKLSDSLYKISVPLVPGLKLERVLKGLDPHYMRLGPLSLVVHTNASERMVSLLARSHGGTTSRFALLMRPQMRGNFVLPSIEIMEQHRVLKSVYWVGSNFLKVE